MASRIPFIPSKSNYRLDLPLSANTRYLFDKIHWNAVDSGWYFDLLEGDETPILTNIKVVLGVQLGARCPHPFFSKHTLRAIDTSGNETDPGLDDLGARVQVVLTTIDDLAQ